MRSEYRDRVACIHSPFTQPYQYHLHKRGLPPELQILCQYEQVRRLGPKAGKHLSEMDLRIVDGARGSGPQERLRLVPIGTLGGGASVPTCRCAMTTLVAR